MFQGHCFYVQRHALTGGNVTPFCTVNHNHALLPGWRGYRVVWGDRLRHRSPTALLIRRLFLFVVFSLKLSLVSCFPRSPLAFQLCRDGCVQAGGSRVLIR